MTVLVFGGLGHVASWVVHDLVQRGDDVAVFDAGAAAFDKLGLDYLEPHRNKFAIENVDILDTHTLFETMRSYDGKIDAVIFSVAVIAGPNFKLRPYRNIEINTVGMLNVIEACRIFGVPKFINLSSGAVYGNGPSGQTETTPYMATDLYCATKIANEVLALQYANTYGIDVRNVRLMAVYGPGRLPSRMHQLYQVLFGPLEGMRDLEVESGGDQSLEWTHVRDSAQGVIRLLDADGMSGESFNISCGQPIAHRDIVRHVEDIIGTPPNVTMGPGKFLDRNPPLDITKAREKLGFEPRYADIRAGLEDYHRWLSGNY